MQTLEICLLCDAKRTASVRAETYCNLYSLTRDDFQRVLSDFPVMRRTIESIAAERLTQIGRDPNLVSEREDLQDDLQIVKELLQSLAANMQAPNSSPTHDGGPTIDADGQSDSNQKTRHLKKGHRASTASKGEELQPSELNPLGKVKRSALARFARVGDLLFHSHESGSHSRAATPSGDREHNVLSSLFMGGRGGGGGVRGSGSGERSHSSSDSESEAPDRTADRRSSHPRPDGGPRAPSPVNKRHHKYRFPYPRFTSFGTAGAAAAAAKRSSLQPAIAPKRHNSVHADMAHLAQLGGVQLTRGDPSRLASCTALN